MSGLKSDKRNILFMLDKYIYQRDVPSSGKKQEHAIYQWPQAHYIPQ